MAFGPSPDSWVITSLEGTHFNTAVADGAIDIENLGAYPTPQVIVSQLTVWSDENLAWDISIWRNNASQPVNSPLEDHGLIHFVRFVAADAARFAGAGPFVYSRANLDIRIPADIGTCFVGITPRGAAKTTGDAGNARVQLTGPVR